MCEREEEREGQKRGANKEEIRERGGAGHGKARRSEEES
jgi:hypothetical protein